MASQTLITSFTPCSQSSNVSLWRDGRRFSTGYVDIHFYTNIGPIDSFIYYQICFDLLSFIFCLVSSSFYFIFFRSMIQPEPRGPGCIL